jgi:hypothetical protein
MEKYDLDMSNVSRFLDRLIYKVDLEAKIHKFVQENRQVPDSEKLFNKVICLVGNAYINNPAKIQGRSYSGLAAGALYIIIKNLGYNANPGRFSEIFNISGMTVLNNAKLLRKLMNVYIKPVKPVKRNLAPEMLNSVKIVEVSINSQDVPFRYFNREKYYSDFLKACLSKTNFNNYELVDVNFPVPGGRIDYVLKSKTQKKFLLAEVKVIGFDNFDYVTPAKIQIADYVEKFTKLLTLFESPFNAEGCVVIVKKKLD